MGARWGPGGPDRCHGTGSQWGEGECCFDPTSVLTLLPVAWRAFRASIGLAAPRTIALRMISWYQVNVSAGQNRCSRPEPYNCSNRAAWTIRSYGLTAGLLITAAQWWWCDCSDCEGTRWGDG